MANSVATIVILAKVWNFYTFILLGTWGKHGVTRISFARFN
jgi:hypothetical protein